MTSTERRINALAAELRNDANGSYITGYASVFGKISRKLGGFVERVNPAAFNESRAAGYPDVICRYNHSDDFVLGTVQAGTLQLAIDGTGLAYSVNAPESRADVTELVQRGDVAHSSFAFRCPDGGDDWTLSDFGLPLRELLSVELVDVAPVVNPAYPDSTAKAGAVSGAVASLARKFDADPAEIRSMLASKSAARLFKRTSTSTSTRTAETVTMDHARLRAELESKWTPDDSGDTARGRFELPEYNPAYMHDLNTAIAQADEDEAKAAEAGRKEINKVAPPALYRDPYGMPRSNWGR